MKRLALFVGALGAIAGCIATFVFLSDILEQRARHQAFERLANSQVVQQQRKLLQQPIVQSSAVTEWDAQGNPILQRPGASTTASTQPQLDWSKAQPLPSEVDKGGIKTINWTGDLGDLGVGSIDTEDGRTLYPEPAPSFWSYLLPLFFPVLGFFIPWGLVSAVVWVGAGFVDNQQK